MRHDTVSTAAPGNVAQAPSPAPARFYAPELDGVRFIAALLVFLHHAPSLPYLGIVQHHGWIGVDLFLVLSALLITRLIMLEIDRTGRFDLRAFYLRRMLRIWPLYLGYITASAGIALMVGAPSPSTVAAWWLSHMTFSANLMTAVQGYSPVFASGHLWTIALEEQAYLILPLTLPILAASARRVRTACLAAAGVLLLLFGMRAAFMLAGSAHPFIWSLPLRADAFAIGMVAALVSVRVAPIHIVTALIALAGLLALAGHPENASFQLVGYPLVAAGLAVLLLACRASSFARTLLASPPLRYLGKISFGIYVFHVVALAAVDRAAGSLGVENDAVIAALALATTIATAAASYHLYELPFLRRKAPLARVEGRPL